MKRLMMAHILCAGLLMLSLESQGAGAGKKVAPKKKAIKAGAGAPAQKQEEKKKKAAGAEVPAVPALPGGKLELFFADIAKGDLVAVEKKIESNKNLLTILNGAGDTALIVATRAGQQKIIDYLIAQYLFNFSEEETRTIIEHKNKEGKSVLDYAPNLKIAGILIEAMGIKPPEIPAQKEEKRIESYINNPTHAQYAEFFKVAGATVCSFEDALFYILLFWVKNPDDQKRQTYLGQLVYAYKRAGGSMKGVIGEIVTGLPSMSDDAALIERVAQEVVGRLITEGATLGTISKKSSPKIIKIIQDIQKEHEERYEEPWGEASISEEMEESEE